MHRAIVGLLLLVAVAAGVSHVARAVHLLGGPGALLSDQPVLGGDYGLHAYYCFVRKGAAGRFELFGYDPYFMAGHPHTLAFPMSSVFFELVTAPFPESAVWPVFKFAILLAAVVPPLSLAAAAYALSRRPGAALVALLLVLSVFWSAQPEIFLRTGLASWLWSSALVVPAVLLGGDAVHAESLRMRTLLTVGSTVLALLAVAAHFLQIVTLGAAWIALLIAVGRRRPIRFGVLSAVAGGLILVGTYPLWRSLPVVMMWLKDPGVFFVPEAPVTEALNFVLTGGHHQWIIVWMAIAAHWLRRAPGGTGPALTVAGCSLLAFALLGALIPGGKELQPLRFQTPALWLLTPVASDGLVELYERLRSLSLSSRVVTTLSALLFLRLLLPGFASVSQPREPLSRPLTSAQRDLVRRLEAVTSPAHRILFEDVSARDLDAELADAIRRASDPDALRYRISPLLPVLIDRSFVGGLYYPGYLVHSTVKFGNGRLFGRPLVVGRDRTFSDVEFASILDRYNIRWAVAWSPRSRAFLDGMPGLSRVLFDVGPYRVYEFPHVRDGFCMEGNATVRFSWNRIQLSHISPGRDGRLVLKFHWAPGLQAVADKGDPPAVRPWTDGRLPVPFVELQFRGQVPTTVTVTATY